jgi:hypothetical protein
MGTEMRKLIDQVKNFGKQVLNEGDERTPNSITLKLTDVWRDLHNLYNMPSQVTLFNDDESYTYIGNTNLTGFGGIIYFASRKNNLIFITGLDMEGAGKNYDLNSLLNLHSKSKREIEKTGLRKFSVGTCTLGELNNSDYSGELEVGMPDHRGYFKIIEIN